MSRKGAKPVKAEKPTSSESQKQIILPKELEPIIKKLEPKDQNIILKSFSISQSHSGPLPPPEQLEKYNQIIPNGAERIMIMAENQSSHRLGIEDKVIDGQVTQSGKGQIFGFIIALISILLSFTLAMFEHYLVAGIIGGSTVVGLVTVFVIGKHVQKKELADKNPKAN